MKFLILTFSLMLWSTLIYSQNNNSYPKYTATLTDAGIQLVADYDTIAIVSYVKNVVIGQSLLVIDNVGNVYVVDTYHKHIDTELGEIQGSQTQISVHLKDCTKHVATIISTKLLVNIGQTIRLNENIVFKVLSCSGEECLGIVNEGTITERKSSISREYLGQLISTYNLK